MGRHHDPELCKAPAEGRSASDLLHEADLKMYEDKIRTKEEQKAKENKRRNKKRRRNENSKHFLPLFFARIFTGKS